MIALLRVIRFAFQHFWRNIWLSLMTVSMLLLTLLTINILILLNQVADAARHSVEEKVEISVYFKPETSDGMIRNASGYLRGLTQVRDVGVITSDEALERFKQVHANDPTILASLQEVGGNPFGPTLVVRAYRVEDFDPILQALTNPEFADQIREKDFSDYGRLIQRMQDVTEKVKWFGVGLSFVFLFIAILIIFNTVRLNVFLYREEIGIMKLVGATDWFVRVPFFVEALFYSILSTGIASVGIFFISSVLEPPLQTYFLQTNVNVTGYFVSNALPIFGSELIAIFLVSILATSFAMRKHLRV